MRLARAAARDGVYTAQAARLVLILGWWLLAGGLVANIAEGFARVNLLAQLVTWHVDRVQWPAPGGVVVAGRLDRPGPDHLRPGHADNAGMRADLEGTV